MGIIEYDPEAHPSTATLLEDAAQRMYRDKGGKGSPDLNQGRIG